jgi:hypothetical protein
MDNGSVLDSDGANLVFLVLGKSTAHHSAVIGVDTLAGSASVVAKSGVDLQGDTECLDRGDDAGAIVAK